LANTVTRLQSITRLRPQTIVAIATGNHLNASRMIIRSLSTEPSRPGRLLRLLAAFTLIGGIGVAKASIVFEEMPLAIEAKSGRFEFVVEVAASPEQRGRGLMFREELAEDRGMLFDFGKLQRASMWMRNTYVPLDMLFIAADGRITQIVTDTPPLSDVVIASREPVRAVLELRAGVTTELGIAPGDRIVHPLFAPP
jgi:uncharacterized membrane protein (UPF0127 family)